MSGRVTHLEFKKDGKSKIYPIKPTKSIENKNYKTILDLPKQDLAYVTKYLEEMDKQTDSSVKKYIQGSVLSMNQDTLFFENMLYLPLQKESSDKIVNKYQNRIQTQYKITGSKTENIVSTEIESYFQMKNEKYRSNMLFLNYLRNRKSKLNEVNTIIQHDIMLKIHKREKR